MSQSRIFIMSGSRASFWIALIFAAIEISSTSGTRSAMISKPLAKTLCNQQSQYGQTGKLQPPLKSRPALNTTCAWIPWEKKSGGFGNEKSCDETGVSNRGHGAEPRRHPSHCMGFLDENCGYDYEICCYDRQGNYQNCCGSNLYCDWQVDGYICRL